MAINPKLKTPLILVGVAVVAYLAYRWWSGRSSSSGSPTGSEGTNLNSVAPELIGVSAGPDSGITYQPPSTVIDITQPVTSGSNPTGGSTAPGTGGGKERPGGGGGSPGTPGGLPLPGHRPRRGRLTHHKPARKGQPAT